MRLGSYWEGEKGFLSLVIQEKQTFDYKAKTLLAKGNLLYTWKTSTVLDETLCFSYGYS